MTFSFNRFAGSAIALFCMSLVSPRILALEPDTLNLVSQQMSALQCEKLQLALEEVRARMRRGYKASEYNALNDRERELSQTLYRYCQ